MRRVLISGVTRGLGRAMVSRFAKSNCDVRGCGRSREHLSALNDLSPSDEAFAAVDVADSRAVTTWASSMLEAGFVPDLLINGAALMNNPAPLWEVPVDEFSRLIDVNIKGTFHLIHAFLPAMISQGRGVVVNFSSGWGRATAPRVAPYCSSKWAIEGLTRALADELPDGLAAVPLNPGVINTDMLRQCWADDAMHYPTPDEWANRAVPFILGLDSRHNGQPLTVP